MFCTYYYICTLIDNISVLCAGKRGLEDLEKFAHDWGELGALRVLSRSFVVLSSFRTFKEAMLSRTRGDQMTGRPVSKMRRTYPPHGHLGAS